jgi:hypothetical protein
VDVPVTCVVAVNKKYGVDVVGVTVGVGVGLGGNKQIVQVLAVETTPPQRTFVD